MLTKISRLIFKKKNKSKIVCLTAYSKNIAEEIDKYTDLNTCWRFVGFCFI